MKLPLSNGVATYRFENSGSYTITAKVTDSAESAWSSESAQIKPNVDMLPPVIVGNITQEGIDESSAYVWVTYKDDGGSGIASVSWGTNSSLVTTTSNADGSKTGKYKLTGLTRRI